MKTVELQPDEYIVELVEQTSPKLGRKLDISSIRCIGHSRGNNQAIDASLAFYIDGNRRGDDTVLLVSNPNFGQTVSADIECAQLVSKRVDKEVSRHISRPIFEGTYGDQTFAFFSRLSPLSNNRFVRRFQRNTAVERVTPWLSRLALQTKEQRSETKDYDRLFTEPLISLEQDKDIPKNIKHYAKALLERIDTERPRLFTIAQHGDFWVGNVLFERRIFEDINPFLGDFSVIDWRGMRLDGYPFIDLVRFCLSLYKVGAKRNSAILQDYRQYLSVPEEDVGLYLMLSLGRLGTELDQFPKERYCSMCDTIFSFIQSHVERL